MEITTDDAMTLAREARTWPTIGELAEAFEINGRSIRKAVANGELVAFRLNVLRVDPDSFVAWLVSRQT